MREYGHGLSVLERHYEKSFDLVPDFMKKDLGRKIRKYAEPYTVDDLQLIENWETSHLVEMDEYQEGHKRLADLLDS